MDNNTGMPEIDNSAPNNAVRIYGQADVMDDFPILKAFQQYINAEQAKARKRIISLGIFFGVLTGAIISVFVLLLINANARNQSLNDRLIEFAMKDRAQQSAVVVQPPQDNSAILALTAKLEDVQKKLAETQAKADREAAVAAERERLAAERAAQKKGPTPEQLEISRLNALLQAEREKAALEKAKAKEEAKKLKEEQERKRQEELEAYRRKHYPELYGLPSNKKPKRKPLTIKVNNSEVIDEDIPLDDDDAIDYFDDEINDESLDIPAKTKPRKKVVSRPPSKPLKKSVPVEEKVIPQPKIEEKVEEPYIIPVEVKGRNQNFRIPF